MMRLPARALALAVVVVFASGGCGGGSGAGALDETLAYFPQDVGVVLVVDTDLESEQLARFDRKVLRAETNGRSLEELLSEGAATVGLSFEDDVRPLLGNPLVLGRDGDGDFTAALRASDATKIREVVDKMPGVSPDGEAAGADLYRAEQGLALAIDGAFLVLAQNREALVRALERRDASDHLTQGRFEAELPEGASASLVRGFADVDSLADFFGLDLERPEIDRLRSLPWFAALRTIGAGISFPDDEHVIFDVALNTEAEMLTVDALPLATGEDAPPIVHGTREIAAANRDQSRTTVFLLRAARAAFPDSRFVQAVDELEQETGIDFEEEILRQFDGPSASLLTFDGQDFAARSAVRDPVRLREQLRILAPHLPRLVQGLEGLRSEGLALLLLLAPDAVASTQPLEHVRVELPREADDLYHVSGLTGDGPSDVYFGLVGDVFVIGSDEQRARAIADAPAETLGNASGAAVARFDASEGSGVLLNRLGFGTEIEVGEVVGSVEASTQRLRATLRVELP